MSPTHSTNQPKILYVFLIIKSVNSLHESTNLVHEFLSFLFETESTPLIGCFMQKFGFICTVRNCRLRDVRCKTHKHSSKTAKFYTKKLVKYLSKCKFYNKYGHTADSTENTVESSVLQSRNFHIKDYSHHFTSNGTQWENISITSMEVDFWGVKSSGCENSHATEFHSEKEAK
jgi:hypothetical protein